METAPTLQKAAETALLIQDAVNLTAILSAWREARRAAGSVPASSVHPLDVLFLSKVSSLMGADSSALGSVTVDGADAFAVAYEWAETVARDGKEG